MPCAGSAIACARASTAMTRLRSLRGRVALWMFAASSLSLAIFAVAAYVVVRIEETIERADPEVALRRPRSPDEWAESARTALGELRRLARVVDSLLRFARADGPEAASTTEVELAGLVDDVTAMHASAAREAGVELIARCDTDV